MSILPIDLSITKKQKRLNMAYDFCFVAYDNNEIYNIK